MTPPDAGADEFARALRHDGLAEPSERAPCGYLSTTPGGTIVRVNAAFLELTGYLADELVGRVRFDELLSAGGRIYHETHFAPMLRMQDAAREIALEIKHRNGERVPVLVNSAVERDAGGAPVLVRTAVFEAGHRRQYERELLRAKQRAEASELRATELARTLQQTLIPPAIPAIRSLDVAAVFRPAGAGNEVGGDFYDVFQLSEHTWAMAIGDVCGKGPEAAVVTALARFTLRAEAMQNPLPSQSLAVLNQALSVYDTDRFCTAVLVQLTVSEGRWSGHVCTAGHPPPLLRRRGGAVAPAAAPGTLLGVVDAPVLHDTALVLEDGDVLVLFTDGVTEARVGDDFYGDARLVAVLEREHETAADLAADLVEDVIRTSGGPLTDDVAVLVVRVSGGQSAQSSRSADDA
jgi:sigma-B regulation protein RsbU (phosphoserine phosphatase)